MEIKVIGDVQTNKNIPISVILPNDATAVDGENYTVTIKDGVGNITITNITAGKHDISANYSGDNQYVAKNTTISFGVDKEDANLVVKIDDVKVGEAINITATLTGINNTKLNGTVNVTINNKTYTIVIISTGFKIGDVFNKSGNNKYIVNWIGDDDYNPIVTEGDFNVSKASDYDFNVTIPDEVKPDENTTITVEYPDDATGNITAIIDGNKNIVVPITNETMNITIPPWNRRSQYHS